MNDLIITLIPSWFIFGLAAATFAHRMYVSIRYEFAVVSRWENVLYAIALLMVTTFYFARSVGWLDVTTGVSLSRIVFVWWLSASLYVSHRMAKRHETNGVGLE